MGAPCSSGLVAPVVRGVHSREPDDLSVDLASPRLRRRAALDRGSLAGAVRELRAAAPAGSQVGRAPRRDAPAREAHSAELRAAGARSSSDAGGRADAVASSLAGGTHRGHVVRRGEVSRTAADARAVTLVTASSMPPRSTRRPGGTGAWSRRARQASRARALTHSARSGSGCDELPAGRRWCGSRTTGRTIPSTGAL